MPKIKSGRRKKKKIVRTKNENIILLNILFFSFLLSILLIGAGSMNQSELGTLSIKNISTEWQIVYQSSNEANFKVIFANAKDKKTDICFILKDGVNLTLVDLTPKQLYNINNNPVLDDKGKTITLKYETAKCNDTGTMKNGYHISLINAQLVNIDNYIKFGNQSMVLIYQDIKILEYSSDWFNINVTLFKLINGEYSNNINNIWIYQYNDSDKFGANDSLNLGIDSYKYLIKSNLPIYSDGLQPYISRDINSIWGYFGNTIIQEHHIFDFGDICNKDLSNYSNFPNCNFNYYEEVLDENTTFYFLEVIFNSDMFIDPTLTIAQATVFEAGILTNNVTIEAATFSHLTIDNTLAPYDSLVAYYPFDVNTATYTYDYSSNNNEGTLNGVAFNSTCDSGYGTCYKFDGVNDNIAVTITGGKNTTTLWIKNSTATSWTFLSKNDTSYFVNGVVGSPAQYPINISGNNVKIGINFSGGQYFNGSIDEVMIFNTSLNSSQILAIYQNTSVRFMNPGQQTIKQVNITSGYNQVGVNLDGYNRFFGTNISTRVGAWDVSLGYNNTDLNGNNGLVSYWHFDEESWDGTTGEVKDAMSLNNGTGNGGVNTSINGTYYRGGSFNGSNAVNIGASPKGIYSGMNGSVSAWVYSLDNRAWSGIVSKSASGSATNVYLDMYRRVGGTFRFVIGNKTGISSEAIITGSALNTWYHVVGTWNGTSVCIYSNGVAGTCVTQTYPFLNSTANLYIGRVYNGVVYSWNGSIDEVMIFNRSLTSDEVKELYVKGRANWNYSSWQNLSAVDSFDNSSSNNFNISTATTNLLPEFSLFAGNLTNPFYSPNLRASLGLILNTQFNLYPGNINSCGVLVSEGTYTLTQNITTDTTCFTVSANNVTINLNGYNINDTSPAFNEYGVTTAYNQTTVKNGAIYHFGRGIDSTGFSGNYTNMTIYSNADFSVASSYGVYTSNNDTSITNNNITVKNTGAGVNTKSYGIYASASNNIIQNNIIDGNTGQREGYGIYLSSSSNNQIINNTANWNNVGSNGNAGIYISSGSNNTLTGNTANSNLLYGIYISSGSNNTLTNNTANSNDYGIYLNSNSNNTITNNTANSNSYGIWLAATSINNNFINNNIWNCTITGEYGCIYIFQGSDNNLFQGGIINLSASNLIYLEHIASTGISNTIFKDLILLGATNNDTVIGGIGGAGSSLNNTFLNVSYNSSRERVRAGSELIRKWYYRAYVNDTSGTGVSVANVSSFMTNGTFAFNLTTNASGWTPIENIIDYVNTGSGTGINRTYYSNYTIFANNYTSPPYLIGGQNFSKNITLLTNLLPDVLTLTYDATNPLIDYGTGTDVNYANLSQSNVYINLSITETNFANITFNLYNSSWNNITTYTILTRLINFTNIADGSYWYFVNITDLANNKNSTSIRNITLDTSNPSISLVYPNDLSEDTDGLVSFVYNVSDLLKIINCSLYLDSTLIQTNTTITKNTNQTFNVINIQQSDNLRWYIKCTDSLNHIGTSSTRHIDTKLGGSTTYSSTQGGIGGFIPILNSSYNACLLTYRTSINDKDYSKIYEIQNKLITKGESLSWTTIREYIDNWQSKCSDLTNITQEPQYVCESIYKMNPSSDFTLNDLNNLKNYLNPIIKLSFPLLQHYIDNYNELCYSNGYSPRITINGPYSLINQLYPLVTSCSPEFDIALFDLSIPLPSNRINLGDLNCVSIEVYRWGVKLEKTNDGYFLVGLKLWWIISLVIFFLTIMIYIKLNKSNKREYKTEYKSSKK